MTPRSKEDYRARQHHNIYYRRGLDGLHRRCRGRGLPRFLPLVRTGLLDSIRLLDDLWQRRTSLSKLMVATQQVEGKDDMRAIQQGRLDTGFTCRKWWLQPMPKVARTHYTSNISSPRNVTCNQPQSPLWQLDLKG
jgi:hypothetical protein